MTSEYKKAKKLLENMVFAGKSVEGALKKVLSGFNLVDVEKDQLAALTKKMKQQR